MKGVPRTANSEGKLVRSLERGLALLQAMNMHPSNNVISVYALAKEVRLPRPTVYRLLDTLCHAGYVNRSASTDQYRLTSRVRMLAAGIVSCLLGSRYDFP